ncbi:hypothetical protein BCR36DRAFT_156388 [Piromyces finnis]|uniref:Uncharacterized protein n=1 Tax=Piromyces finnis TaxID=1754191 RepID=A0A1Y1UWS9_9FUNG|nr:hypothetical protein BCR36DRAFT_156388 [Piromyces finnis]|eukprot:ORX42608.1 hypothetical protein BCR36DRAFT_156388 [Piromyces finnis]
MSCVNTVSSPERHPLRWVLTRQLGNFLWYLGEIVADWYPLLRTKAVVKEKHLIRWVFISCGIYNLSKIILIGIHFKVTPSQLYNEKGEYDKDRMDMFYFVYWVVQLIIIYTSALYDLFVYLVLKKSVFTNSRTDIGFFKKFKTISEYRILLSAIISALFLPIVSVTIIIKFIYYIKYNFHDLDFSFDEVRKIISNVQYYMIFIDQILLFQSKQETSYDTNVSSNSYKLSLNKSNGSRSEKFQYSTLNNSTNALLSRSTIEQSESNTNTNMIISSMDYYNNTFNTITRKEINMNNYKFGNNNNSNRTKDRNVS